MFQLYEVVIRLALKHFKRNMQIALLEIRSHFIQNMSTISVSLFP
jgi:hypothetical protein